MPRYLQKSSRQFFEDGLIEEISDIDNYLQKATNWRERTYMMLLFITGARPSEILALNADDVYKAGTELIIDFKKTLKNGRARTLYRKLRGAGTYIKYAKSILELINANCIAGQQIFSPKWNRFRANYTVEKLTKKKYNSYFFRHHLHSVLARRGASRDQLKYNKGSVGLASVEPYVHISMEEQQRIGSLLNKTKERGITLE